MQLYVCQQQGDMFHSFVDSTHAGSGRDLRKCNGQCGSDNCQHSNGKQCESRGQRDRSIHRQNTCPQVSGRPRSHRDLGLPRSNGFPTLSIRVANLPRSSHTPLVIGSGGGICSLRGVTVSQSCLPESRVFREVATLPLSSGAEEGSLRSNGISTLSIRVANLPGSNYAPLVIPTGGRDPQSLRSNGFYRFQRFDSSYMVLKSTRCVMFSAPESPRTTSSNCAASR